MSDEEEILILANPEVEDEYDFENMKLDLDLLPPDGDGEEADDEPIPDEYPPAPARLSAFTTTEAMSSLPTQVIGAIRTITPMIVGWILTGVIWLLGILSGWFDQEFTLPADLEIWLQNALPVVLGSAYYLVARKWLEPKWPNIPWLGSKQQPIYDGASDVEQVVEARENRTAVATFTATPYVWWRGGRFSTDFRDSQVDVDKEVPGFVLVQGGYNNSVSASAGTHLRDAADYSVRGKTEEEVGRFITAQRKRGNFASFRTTKKGKWGVRAQGFKSYHVHVVPNGHSQMSAGSLQQALAYRRGRDGLRSNGPDAGGPGHTRNYTNMTWPKYKAAQTTPVVSVNAIPRHITPKPWMTIPVTGKLDGTTISRLQWQLNVKPTGKLDHYTIRALKVWLGNTDDGKGVLSPHNIKQLQYRVGLRGGDQDGIWNSLKNPKVPSPTTERLQVFLNTYK